MNEEIGAVIQHGAVGPHPAARGIDAPALTGGITRPGKRYRTVLRGRGAEMPDLALATSAGSGNIFEPDPVENILTGRKTFEQ